MQSVRHEYGHALLAPGRRKEATMVQKLPRRFDPEVHKLRDKHGEQVTWEIPGPDEAAEPVKPPHKPGAIRPGSGWFWLVNLTISTLFWCTVVVLIYVTLRYL